jgi:hypothetical protein
MSIEGITKFYDWMEKARPAKIFWVIVFFVYGLLLFEQFTGHYRLTRLEKSITVLEAMSLGPAQEAVRAQVEQQSAKMFILKQTSPVLLRIACGGWMFLLVVIMTPFSPQGFWNFCKALLCFAFAGGLIALIPDFLPTWKECLYASGVYLFGIGFSAVDALNDPTI